VKRRFDLRRVLHGPEKKTLGPIGKYNTLGTIIFLQLFLYIYGETTTLGPMLILSPYSGSIKAAQRAFRVTTRNPPRRAFTSDSIPRTASDVDDEARRLIRALLRECSYLPDSLARTRIKQQILSRFERRKRNNKARLKRLERDAPFTTKYTTLQPDTKDLLKSDFKKAYKTLRQLQAANNGELVQLDKILRLTYGRTGPYRRELLAPLLFADPVDGSELLIQKIQNKQGPVKSEWTVDTVRVDKVFLQPPLVQKNTVIYNIAPEYSKLKALATSQVKAHPPAMRGLELKSAEFKMPAKNTWDRMMPRLRVKNMVHRAYANLLDRLHPPLNEEDWNRLRGLAHGTLKGEGFRPRRKRIAAKPGMLTSYDVEKLAHLGERSTNSHESKEDAWLDNPDAVEEAKEDLLKDELSIGKPLNKNTKGRIAGHQIKLRLMQRLWKRIFEACPLLTWDETRNNWNVTWGHSLENSQSNDELAPLFETLDKTNAKIKKSNSRGKEMEPLRKNDHRTPPKEALHIRTARSSPMSA
jgi:hypothetical protein